LATNGASGSADGAAGSELAGATSASGKASWAELTSLAKN
jgi:hypothetical protein